MLLQDIPTGLAANDGAGIPLRTAFQRIQGNFDSVEAEVDAINGLLTAQDAALDGMVAQVAALQSSSGGGHYLKAELSGAAFDGVTDDSATLTSWINGLPAALFTKDVWIIFPAGKKLCLKGTINISPTFAANLGIIAYGCQIIGRANGSGVLARLFNWESSPERTETIASITNGDKPISLTSGGTYDKAFKALSLATPANASLANFPSDSHLKIFSDDPMIGAKDATYPMAEPISTFHTQSNQILIPNISFNYATNPKLVKYRPYGLTILGGTWGYNEAEARASGQDLAAIRLIGLDDFTLNDVKVESVAGRGVQIIGCYQGAVNNYRMAKGFDASGDLKYPLTGDFAVSADMVESFPYGISVAASGNITIDGIIVSKIRHAVDNEVFSTTATSNPWYKGPQQGLLVDNLLAIGCISAPVSTHSGIVGYTGSNFKLINCQAPAISMRAGSGKISNIYAKDCLFSVQFFPDGNSVPNILLDNFEFYNCGNAQAKGCTLRLGSGIISGGHRLNTKMLEALADSNVGGKILVEGNLIIEVDEFVTDIIAKSYQSKIACAPGGFLHIRQKAGASTGSAKVFSLEKGATAAGYINFGKDGCLVEAGFGTLFSHYGAGAAQTTVYGDVMTPMSAGSTNFTPSATTAGGVKTPVTHAGSGEYIIASNETHDNTGIA